MRDPESASSWMARLNEALRRAQLSPDAALLLAFAVTVLVTGLWSSRLWRITQDTPMMMYQAFLINEHGRVPYRDFFDMNMPGTYLVYALIGKLFGYTDFQVRIADWLLTAALLGAMAGMMRSASRRVAVLAACTFGIYYLVEGPRSQLQREFLAFLPISVGVWIGLSAIEVRRRAFFTGLAFGFASTIKPHLSLGMIPPAIAGITREGWRGWPESARLVGVGLAGFMVPWGVAVTWMLATGVLGDFVNSLEYLKYYGAFTTDMRILTGSRRLAYLWHSLFGLGGHHLVVMAGLFGVALGTRHASRDHRRLAWTIAGLMFAFWLYPLFPGHFWFYHWMPLVWASCLGTALLFDPLLSGTRALVPRIALWLVLCHLSDADNLFRAFARHERAVPKGGRPDRIAAWLSQHAEPGDKVQPMDWITGGVAHGLLMARLDAATDFVYSFHFHHHVQAPYQRALRKRFVTELDAVRPRFIVENQYGRPYFKGGRNIRDEIPEADSYIRQHYAVAESNRAFTVWERSD